ncbi:DUF2141 domain-containing protein [Ekhidna sp.]|uniref:DUF2141 domain-containing protein n=1 Tax=Ekhidna sp. TaxID=2608089 RepID=UPI003299435F
MKRLSLSILFLFSMGVSFAQVSCELKIRVENIKKLQGSMKIAIYDHEDHFLKREILSKGKPIEDHNVEFIFNGLGKGIYAISVYHDENDNGELDANFMGIPSEPYAFSNNAKGMFGPPSFEDCQFEIVDGFQEIVISL